MMSYPEPITVTNMTVASGARCSTSQRLVARGAASSVLRIGVVQATRRRTFGTGLRQYKAQNS